jgi:hypothetical protein
MRGKHRSDRAVFLFYTLFNNPFLLIFFLPTSYCKAKQNYKDSLNKVIAENKNEAEVSGAYNAQAYQYTRKYPAKARYNLSATITVAKKVNNPIRLSNTYSQLLYVIYDGGKPYSA